MKAAELREKSVAELKEQLTDLIEKSVSDLSDGPMVAEMTKFMQVAQEKMEEATKAFTPEAAKKPTAKPAARKAADAA